MITHEKEWQKPREDELANPRSSFELHCLIARGKYRFQQYVAPTQLLRSQLIASAGFEAYQEYLNATAG